MSQNDRKLRLELLASLHSLPVHEDVKRGAGLPVDDSIALRVRALFATCCERTEVDPSLREGTAILQYLYDYRVRH